MHPGHDFTHYMSVPIAGVRQIIRQGSKDLTIMPTPSAGLAIDILIAAGAVKKSFVSYVGLESYGLAPNFRRAVEKGEIEVSDCDEATVVYGYRAAAAGLPYALLPAYYKMTSLPKSTRTIIAKSRIRLPAGLASPFHRSSPTSP